MSINACVLDFETTGFKPGEIVEFAAVRIRDGALDLHLASLCRPSGRIPASAARVHGITNRMVADQPSFSELLPTLLSFIGEDTVVCHNTPFDMSFLLHYCRLAGIHFAPRTADTLLLARKLFPFLPSKSLQPVAQHLGISAQGYHRALADATVTAQIYIKMLDMMEQR